MAKRKWTIFKWAALVIILLFTLGFGFLALRIYAYRNSTSEIKADAAVVLGAAVWGTQLSPVFRERVSHAVDLYKQGKVRKIIFTGGQGNPNEPTESLAARGYAIASGVPASDILIEQKSHTTYENMFYAKQVADANHLHSILIISDPMHMKRAMLMANDLGLQAYPSPTPTTRYQSVRSQVELLLHETYYYTGYLIQRTFIDRDI